MENGTKKKKTPRLAKTGITVTKLRLKVTSTIMAPRIKYKGRATCGFVELIEETMNKKELDKFQVDWCRSS